MATAVENTPKWFDAELYLTNKLAMLQEAEPSANWTREMVNKAFVENGFSNPYDHYLIFGDMEGLNPNALFDATEYVAAKAAQLGSTWTTEMVRQNIKDAGMTLAEHYAKYGFMEGLNPSSDFDQSKYLDAKLEQLLADDPKGEWTLAKVRESFLANGITPLEHYMVYGKIEGLHDPKYDYSVNGNPIPHPGADIALTTGTDTVGPKGAEGFVTSSRDDLITGVVSSISSKGTFNNTDVIDGAEGRDVLKLDMQGSFGGFKDGAGVKNVETIALDNAGGNNFNAKGVESAGLYVVNVASGKTTNLTNIDSAHTAVQLTSGLKGALNIGYTDAALSGKTDNAYVYLNGVGEAQETQNDRFELKVAAASSAQKAETVTLNSMGTGNFVKLGGNYDTVAVTGAADLDLFVDVKDLKNFDASKALGDVKVDLIKSTDLKSVLGGEGDDSVTVAKISTSAVLNGGAGLDTLTFDGSTALSGKVHVSGFETFVFKEVATSSAVNHVIDMTNITDLNTIKYEAVASGDDTFTVKNADVSEFSFLMKDTVAATGTTAFAYDGTGALNVGLYGKVAATAGNAVLDTLTAKSISELSINNSAEHEGFTISAIDANKVEVMNVNTGTGDAASGGVTISAATMGALTSINVSGESQFSYTGSTEKALSAIDASELTGTFALDLSAITPAGDTGVTVNMGIGGTDGLTISDTGLKGTTKADTFNLGAGSEMVVLMNTTGKQFADTISNFTTSDDILNLKSGLGATTANAVNATTLASKAAITDNNAYVIADGTKGFTTISGGNVGLTDFADLAKVAAYLNTGYLGTTTDGDEAVFVINSGDHNSAYIYKYVEANTTATFTETELSLIAIVGCDNALTTADVIVS